VYGRVPITWTCLIDTWLSYGENRTVGEAPVHIFDSIADSQDFISILCLGLFFVWDVEITSLDNSLAISISHDEWLEYRFAPGEGCFVAYLKAKEREGMATPSPSTLYRKADARQE
jgi:hypothetical protein